MARWVSVLVLGMLIATSVVANTCDICDRRLGRQFLRASGKVFCSKTCFNKTLPTCHICDRRLSGRYIVADGHNFCSQRCHETTLPSCERCNKRLMKSIIIREHTFCRNCADSDRCSICNLPFREGVKLADRRAVCRACHATAISSLDMAKPLFAKARQRLRQITGLQTEQVPELALVDLPKLVELTKLHPHSTGMTPQGFYHRHETSTRVRSGRGKLLSENVEVKKTVYLLHTMSTQGFMSTAVHELTHDLLAEFFPQWEDAPAWVDEGICQYNAAELCRQMGFTDELKQIATSKDPVYGAGYRYFAEKFGPGNWSKIEQWLRQQRPERLPKELK